MPSYACPDNVLSRSVGDELVLVELERELYFSLNETGASVWSALQAGNGREGAVQQLIAQGASADQAEEDVDQLIERLLDLGLLTTT